MNPAATSASSSSVPPLQLTDSRTTDEFTFIPYGLDSKISKEAVKVHVLHGRKRRYGARDEQQEQQQQRQQAFVLHWDSRAEARVRSTGGGVSRRREPKKVVTANAAAAVVEPHISMDHEVLRNPFVEKLKGDTGLQSALHVQSTNFLVDHYLARCGRSRFPNELLAYYWQDTASFKAFLAHAATLFSLETGLIPPVKVGELMSDAIREVARCLSDPVKQKADGTMVAVAILANVEEGRAQHATANTHWKGLKQMLVVRGDLRTVRLHRDLHTMLLWREILTSNSQDVCLGHNIGEVGEQLLCNEHLVEFFNGFVLELAADDDDSKTRRSHGDNGIQSFLASVLRRDASLRCDWTSSMQSRAEIACLVYLAILTISCPNSPEARTRLQDISDEVVERDRWGLVTQEELLFILLQHGDLQREWRCQQLWQLSRCVYLTRTLPYEDWKTIRDILSLFIGLEEGCDDRHQVLERWKDLSERLMASCCRWKKVSGSGHRRAARQTWGFNT